MFAFLKQLFCRHDWFRYTKVVYGGAVVEFRSCKCCGKGQRRDLGSPRWTGWPA